MANAKRDQNRRTVGLASDGTTTQPIKVDPSNQRLIAGIESVASFPATSSPAIRRDANRVPGVLVVTDNAARTPSPLLTDSSGNIICDIVVE